MSIKAEPTEHEQEMQTLTKKIIEKLDILIRHSEEITDETFTEEDIDDDDN